MSPDTPNAESYSASTDSQKTCPHCGDPITYTVVCGPGAAANSCGCSTQPDLVADGGQSCSLCIVGEDGDDPGACFDPESGETFYLCKEHRDEWSDRVEVVDGDDQLVADGGVPKSFEDLAGTCESCGDKVDPDRLIEGECPGCHYRPDAVADGGIDLEDIGTVVSSTQFEGDRFVLEAPDAAVAFDFMSPELARATAETILPDGYKVVEKQEPVTDGGVHTVTRDGQEFCVVRQQEFVDESEMDVSPSGVIRNYDDLEKQTTVRLISLDAIRAEELWNRVIGPDDSDWREEYADLELGECIVPEQDDPVTDGGGVTWSDLTGFKRDVLEAIQRLDNEGETTYGLAIKRELERVYEEEVNHGRLYPNLDDLVDADLVEKGELDKRTNRYDLTAEGKSMLEQRARLLADACGMEQPVADGGDSA